MGSMDRKLGDHKTDHKILENLWSSDHIYVHIKATQIIMYQFKMANKKQYNKHMKQ